MTIAAISEHHKELSTFFPGEDIEWILLKAVPAAGEYPRVDIYLDLDFVNEERRRQELGRLLPAVILVNAVTPTLREIGLPFVRINGWPGFRERKLHELVMPDEATARKVTELYSSLGCSYLQAPDTPGMIGPRIVAGIINEAWHTWEEKVSTKEEIDIAMKLGTNYPFGPFEWSELIGADHILSLLWSLNATDPRYCPAKSLQQAVLRIKM
jgi:3-hydroxybutyryl-CoA dehydrogenase